jgi:hypothetical protein
MFKEFIKDYSFRLFRTALQGFFLMLATNYGQNFSFTEGNAEQATGAVMLLATMGWTAFDAWRNSRSRKAAKLLNAGETSEAKLVAAGQKSK